MFGLQEDLRKLGQAKAAHNTAEKNPMLSEKLDATSLGFKPLLHTSDQTKPGQNMHDLQHDIFQAPQLGLSETPQSTWKYTPAASIPLPGQRETPYAAYAGIKEDSDQ
ncbi:hypothetical protein DACRYDRAFT_108081 [Dacryopinax primogenitus]|uniref:Uncharacterized protein n=1 Tax=Dacryopinax primogenitus (strain DJM 731) TaxID=1858805 RepID=M5GBY0_DACPD|nr:uncharacterized protein DACRYDRAFT_108081 [Dacryopinax primogenitus]EJU01533.1 hypothetical protein DACRYDRAFT_108081 [Dacryopinax primogenitus]